MHRRTPTLLVCLTSRSLLAIVKWWSSTLSSCRFPKHRHNQAHHRLHVDEELTHVPLVRPAVMTQSRSPRRRIMATTPLANTRAPLGHLALSSHATLEKLWRERVEWGLGLVGVEFVLGAANVSRPSRMNRWDHAAPINWAAATAYGLMAHEGVPASLEWLGRMWSATVGWDNPGLAG
jgi:hypothetical protein